MKLMSLMAGTAFVLAVTAAGALAAPMPESGHAHYGWNPNQGKRATAALNLLEAKGYGNFHGFRADGRNFSAMVTRHGKTMTVLADPDTNTVRPIS